MDISIELISAALERPQSWSLSSPAECGALVEFFGIVRATEGSHTIEALTYEAHPSMAEKMMREKILLLAKRHPCQGVRVVHRIGRVAVGESAIYVGVRARHRGEAFCFLQEFMDELKRDVPIWKMPA